MAAFSAAMRGKHTSMPHHRAFSHRAACLAFIHILGLTVAHCLSTNGSAQASVEAAGGDKLNQTQLPAPTPSATAASTYPTPPRNSPNNTDHDPPSAAAASYPASYPAPPPKLPRTNHSDPYPPSYFAICTIIKDQSSDLREWLFYHHWRGAGTIYVYDHNSSLPLSATIEDWIRSGVVVYTWFAGHHVVPTKLFRNTAQGYAYQDCLSRSARKHEWLAFLDADEYLVVTDANISSIQALLKQYKKYGGLAVNWRVFGSSGHTTRPRLPVLQAYTQCIPDENEGHNIHVKTIAHVRYTRSISTNPHTFKYVKGRFSVTEQFRRCRMPFCSPVSVARIAVHHYATKSLEEYQGKVARGGGSGSMKKQDFFDSLNLAATGECLDGVRAYKACCSHLHEGTR